MSASIRNELGAVRQRRGIAAAGLAAQTGVSRQTIHAIEGGSYVPNTALALKLARALDVSVEELFSLEGESAAAPRECRTGVLSAVPVAAGQPVRVCRVGGQLVSIPVTPAPQHLAEADALITREWACSGKGRVSALSGEEPGAKAVVIAGCDPALGLLARMAEKSGGTEIVPAAASSTLALAWLARGKVHVAGAHLLDPGTGEFNLPYLRSRFPGEDFAVISYAGWEQGFVVAAGNPKRIRRIEDLARRGARFINREAGSGSRALLDRLLSGAGIAPAKLRGYDQEARGHLAAAYAVASGWADCCVATGSSARAFGLDFIPLQAERYDFVMRRATLGEPPVARLMDLLQRAALRRRLEQFAGYDTALTGSVLR